MNSNQKPQNQAELDARVAAANRRQETWNSGSIMGMLHGYCLGGSFSPLVLTYRYRSDGWMRNPMGVTHGGVLATMFDNAMGITAYILSPAGFAAPTAELHVSYLRPVPIEAELDIRVMVDHAGSRMVRMRAELRRRDDEMLLATASAVNCPIQREI